MSGAPNAGDAAGPKAAAPTGVSARVAASGAGRIDSIDSLRAMAMTAVIAQHCKLLPFGWVGVWLFFVISGFVVTTSLLSRPEAERRRPWSVLGQFYARRAARIWPIYFGYVGVGCLVSAIEAGRVQWSVLASFVLFYNNFFASFAPDEFAQFAVTQLWHLWTIAVEFQFYIVFGLAFALLPLRLLKWLLAGFLVLSPLLRYAGGAWMQAAGFDATRAAITIYTFSPMHFDSFAAGALLALGREAWSRRSRALGLLACGAAVFAAYCVTYVLINRTHGAAGLSAFRNVISGVLFGDLREVWLYSAVAALSAGVLATTLADVAVWNRVTGSPLLQLVGRVSYGGYVYHIACIWGLGELMQRLPAISGLQESPLAFGLVLFLAALPVTVAVAWVSYRFIEQPIISAVGRQLKRTAPAAAPARTTLAPGAAGPADV